MTFEDVARESERLMGHVEAVEAQVAALERELAALTAEQSTLDLTNAALQTLLSAVSAEALADIERMVTYALRTVFDDQSLSFRLVVDVQRGVQTVEPRLVDGSVEAPILDAFGGGPATVCAFMLRLLVIRRLGLAPLVLLDESFAMVSERYLPNVGKLLRELADKMQFTILLVTHQSEFEEHAHRVYRAVRGLDGTAFERVVAA